MMAAIDRLRELAPPPARPRPAIDWEPVEARLGAGLSADYKELVETYGPGAFDNFLWVLQPSENKNLDLLHQVDVRLSALRVLEEEGDEEVPFDLDPGWPEIIPWAVTDNGDVCYWRRDREAAPEAWTVAVNESRGPEWEAFEGSATEFLAAVLSRAVRLSVFPRGFPSDTPTFRPL